MHDLTSTCLGPTLAYIIRFVSVGLPHGFSWFPGGLFAGCLGLICLAGDFFILDALASSLSYARVCLCYCACIKLALELMFEHPVSFFDQTVA